MNDGVSPLLAPHSEQEPITVALSRLQLGQVVRAVMSLTVIPSLAARFLP